MYPFQIAPPDPADGNIHRSGLRLTADQVRGQLARILTSSLFVRSPQAARILSFLVDESFHSEGETANNFKEYSIAIRVMGREASFDPNANNIVRVEIRRVRSKLAKYYDTEGASDPIIISIPKGTYVPYFELRNNSEFDLTGRMVSHYELLRRGGGNQWETTYDARCLHLNRSVTVIVPTRLTLEDEPRRDRLLESVRAGAVDHAHVASTLDVDTENSRIIIATSQSHGESLRQYVLRGPLSPELKFPFAFALASALAAGHITGVCHGNLQPDSVLLDDEPDSTGILRPLITPFGLSPLVDTAHPAFEGFRPPEWSSGHEPDLRSDVWSFGAMLWFAYFGVPPSQTTVSEGDPDQLGTLEMADVITRCLHRDPLQRYASAIDLLDDVRNLQESYSVAALPGRAASIPHRRIIAPTALLVVALIITIIASAYVRRNTTPAEPSTRRVVVLPLENLTGKSHSEAYSRVIAEMLAGKFARIHDINLVSSPLIGQDKSTEFSLKLLKEKLQADYAVRGTLIEAGSRVHLTLQLTNVRTGTDSWTRSYSGAWSDVLNRIDEGAKEITGAMGLAILPRASR